MDDRVPEIDSLTDLLLAEKESQALREWRVSQPTD
jgi:hypothetical protein